MVGGGRRGRKGACPTCPAIVGAGPRIDATASVVSRHAAGAVNATPSEELLGPLNAVERRFAPAGLWVVGDRSLLARHPRVAVVGTRTPTEDGAQRARRLVRELVSHDAIIVSGLAQGVDTIAHTAAMVNGRTIAVIGTPLDDVFPMQNAELQRRIASRDLVVSEFAPGTKVARGNFPRRNRTMALIADASVIIEAGDGSGTLSQGWEVLRLGRPLFFLRSLLDADLQWPKEMMKYGAQVLSRTEDLLELLPRDDGHATASF